MTTITKSDVARVRAAVEAAEGRTSAELVTVIARAAEPYLFIPTLFAAVVTMAVSGLVLLLLFGAGLSAAELYTGQVLAFVVIAVLCRLPAVRFALVPRAIRNTRASRLAHEM